MNKVVFIGAGPGDPELITLKGKRYLEQADIVIYAGSLLNPEILKYAKSTAKLYDSAKMSLPEVLKIMIDAAKNGKFVARVHDGDPSFYGAIQEQMDALDKEKIEYFRVPGVSCLQGGAGALNRELTLPNISQTVIITRPEGRTPVPEAESIRKLAAHQATMVIFLGTPHIARRSGRTHQGRLPQRHSSTGGLQSHVARTKNRERHIRRHRGKSESSRYNGDRADFCGQSSKPASV